MIDNRPASLGAWLLRLLPVVLLVAPASGQDEPAAPQPLAGAPPTHGTEPSTWLLLATGLALILLLRYHQQRRQPVGKPQPRTRGQPREPATSPSSR